MSLQNSNSVTFFCQWNLGYLSFPPNPWVLVRISSRWWGWRLVFRVKFHRAPASWWTRIDLYKWFFKALRNGFRDSEKWLNRDSRFSILKHSFVISDIYACVMHVSTLQRYCCVLQYSQFRHVHLLIWWVAPIEITDLQVAAWNDVYIYMIYMHLSLCSFWDQKKQIQQR